MERQPTDSYNTENLSTGFFQVLGKEQLPIIGTDGCLHNACLLF